MREIRTSGATRGEVALRVLPYSTGEKMSLDKLSFQSKKLVPGSEFSYILAPFENPAKAPEFSVAYS